MTDNGPYSGRGNNGRTIHPLGVDVHQNQHKHGQLSGSVIAIIVLSAFVALVLCSAVGWIFLFRKRDYIGQAAQAASLPSLAIPPGRTNCFCHCSSD